MKVCSLIYGRAKVGKSTFADSAPGPRLIVDAEMGSDYLTSEQHTWDIEAGEALPDLGEDDTCVVHVHDYTTVGKILEFLDRGEHPFETVIVDSITEIQQRCIDDKVGTAQMKIQDWGEIKRKLSLDIRNYRDLKAHGKKPIHVIFISTLEEKVDDDGSIRYIPYMQGSIGTELPYIVDVVGLLSLDKENIKKRLLTVGAHPQTSTGDRTGYLPDVIDNPDYYEILDMIADGAKAAKAARKEKMDKRKRENNG